MKVSAFYIAIFALALLILPMIALNVDMGQTGTAAPVHTPAVPPQAESAEEDSKEAEKPEDSRQAREIQEIAEIDEEIERESEPLEELGQAEYASTTYGTESFKILDESTGEVYTVSVRDYVRGAVAAEMPVSFHEEALKAQAVAAHTYALYHQRMQQEAPDPSLQGADFSADPSNRKIFLTEEAAMEFFGEDASRHWDTVCKAADSVLHYIMEYDDEPIVAAYHAMSAGRTEGAENVWTTGAPYLQPVESEGDLLAPNYEIDAYFTVEEVREALEAAYPAIALSEDPSQWFEGLERSNSGYVTSLVVGGVELHGKDLRTLFNLRSHNLDIHYSDTGFVFTTYGYGHGVGLSQYGADFLARQGYSFAEILEAYYTGVTIKQVELEL